MSLFETRVAQVTLQLSDWEKVYALVAHSTSLSKMIFSSVKKGARGVRDVKTLSFWNQYTFEAAMEHAIVSVDIKDRLADVWFCPVASSAIAYTAVYLLSDKAALEKYKALLASTGERALGNEFTPSIAADYLEAFMVDEHSFLRFSVATAKAPSIRLSEYLLKHGVPQEAKEGARA